jgi:tetratricopeptide (TPR) repeat protein
MPSDRIVLRDIVFIIIALALAQSGAAAVKGKARAVKKAKPKAVQVQPKEALEALYPLDGLGDDSASLYIRAERLLALGRDQESIRAFGKAYWEHPSKQSGLLWQMASAYRRTGAYQTAIALYQKAIIAEPDLRDYGLACISLCFGKLDEDRKADQYRQRISDEIWVSAVLGKNGSAVPPAVVSYLPPTRPNPTIRQANRYLKKKKLEKARKLLSDFVRLYPRSPYRGEAAYTLARCLERQGKLEEACQAYLKVQEYQSASAWADDGLFRAGWCRYKLGDRALALATWDQVLHRSGGDKLDETLYWCGRVSSENGDSNRAFLYYSTSVQNYPYSFYGLKSRLVLDSCAWRQNSSDSPDLAGFLKSLGKSGKRESGPGIPPVSATAGRNGDLFDSAYRLARLGLLDHAAVLARLIEGRAAGSPLACYQLARVYHFCGMHAKAIYWGQKAVAQVPDSCRQELLGILYPRKYLDAINQNINGSGLDPALVLAVIRQESKFEALARSRAGARGLMQVMPKTGKHMARMSRQKGFDSKSLYHPEVSIAYGTKFLNSMVKMFDGSIIKALAAYNAGPGRVREWLKPLADKDDDDFLLQEIPVAETRKYVKIVMENYYIYRMLMEPL